MFRIRQISDPDLPTKRREIEQAQALLRERLPGLPSLVVREGGYLAASLGANARAFFAGLAAAE